MRTAEVRIYDRSTGRLIEGMGKEPIADAKATLDWVKAEIAKGDDAIRVRLIETGSF